MKEDDMDEMLRKAAENYSVDEDKAADWNFVYRALHDDPLQKPVEKTKKRRFVFLWLLLIPLGWIANTEYNKIRLADKEKSKLSIPSQTKTRNQTKQPEEVVTNKPVKPTNENIRSENSKTHLSVRYETKFSSQPINNNIATEQQTSQNVTRVEDLNKNNKSLKDIKPSPDKENDLMQAPDIIQQKNILADNNKTANDKQITQSTKAISHNKIPGNNTHYFYAGFLTGGDFSYVKFQKLQSVGYNLGALVGYKFNRLSIESGIFLDKKNYYTKGEYFDKSKIPFPNNARLLSVDGYCRMYEIPLNIRYDISEKKKHTWFATAGISSYLMNKEFYNYAYKQNGEYYRKGYPYFHTSKDWFSVVNLSAGYQLQTGSKSSLRIEPYYKTTLSGVGTGNLSISSTGINIGIVRRIN